MPVVLSTEGHADPESLSLGWTARCTGWGAGKATVLVSVYPAGHTCTEHQHSTNGTAVPQADGTLVSAGREGTGPLCAQRARPDRPGSVPCLLRNAGRRGVGDGWTLWSLSPSRHSPVGSSAPWPLPLSFVKVTQQLAGGTDTPCAGCPVPRGTSSRLSLLLPTQVTCQTAAEPLLLRTPPKPGRGPRQRQAPVGRRCRPSSPAPCGPPCPQTSARASPVTEAERPAQVIPGLPVSEHVLPLRAVRCSGDVSGVRGSLRR